MSKPDSARMLKLAWVPAVHAKHGSAVTLGITLECAPGAHLLSTVIPLKSGMHVNFNFRSVWMEQVVACIRGRGPGMTEAVGVTR